jgi:hypothetical protein
MEQQDSRTKLEKTQDELEKAGNFFINLFVFMLMTFLICIKVNIFNKNPTFVLEIL